MLSHPKKESLVQLLALPREKPPANTPIQHLYRLLSKHNDQNESDRKNFCSLDNREYSPKRQAKISVQIKYSPKPELQEDQRKLDKQPTEGSPPRKSSLLEGFNRRMGAQFTRGKKNSSTQKTNLKLKSIIFGKHHKKKTSFFDSSNYIEDYDTLIHCQPQDLIAGEGNKVPENSHLTQLMRYQQSIIEREDEKMEISQIIGQGEGIKPIQQVEIENGLKGKPIESTMKKLKFNRRLMINGLGVGQGDKNNRRPTQLCDVTRNKPTSKYMKTCLEELTLEGKEAKISSNNWKIESIPMIITDKYTRIPTSTKLIKKTSIETLLSKCFPDLLVSQHVLWKLHAMFQFYALVLLSFASTSMCLPPTQLPRYQKKQISYTYFVGNGNNRALIVEAMSRRWWWKQVTRWQDANFVWTQHKIQALMQGQSQCECDEVRDKKTRKESMKKQWLQSNQKSSLSMLFRGHGEDIEVNQFRCINPPSLLHNHLSRSSILGDKKYLLALLQLYLLQFHKSQSVQLHTFVPHTYHVHKPSSSQHQAFLKEAENSKDLWIVKPGENSNRGRGIFLSQSTEEINAAIIQRSQTGGSTIIQKYIGNLMLYHGRKFDIRTYLLCVVHGGVTKFYWYGQGYLRTSSHPYSIKDLNPMVHLTNDAVQSQGQLYGRHEKGNKLSYAQLQHYIDQEYTRHAWKVDSLLTNMKEIARTVAQAAHPLLHPANTTSFELFGLDFLVDSHFRPWLLEVNTNPCLELSSPLLHTLIPGVIENVLRLAVDPLLPPTMLPSKEYEYILPDKILQWNKFEVLFDSLVDSEPQWQSYATTKWEVFEHPT